MLGVWGAPETGARHTAKFTGEMTRLDVAGRSMQGSLYPGFSQGDLPNVHIPGPPPRVPSQELRALESVFSQTPPGIVMHTFGATESYRGLYPF